MTAIGLATDVRTRLARQLLETSGVPVVALEYDAMYDASLRRRRGSAVDARDEVTAPVPQLNNAGRRTR